MDPFDSMLRERLVHLLAAAPGSPGPAPILPSRVGPRLVTNRRYRTLAPIGAILVLVAAAMGGAWYLAGIRSTPVDDAGAVGAGDGQPIVWDGGHIRLSADSLRLVTPDKVFTASGIEPTSVKSVRGDGYGTLEVQWREHEIPMRLNIYFAADDTHWWATEVRVYDGTEPGDWIGWGGDFTTSPDDPPSRVPGSLGSRLRAFGVPPDAEVLAIAATAEGYLTDVTYRDSDGKRHRITCDRSQEQAGCAPPLVDLGLFRTRRGDAWTGDVDLVRGGSYPGDSAPASGELHIENMRLLAFG